MTDLNEWYFFMPRRGKTSVEQCEQFHSRAVGAQPPRMFCPYGARDGISKIYSTDLLPLRGII
jgi:hypothetical protein